MKRDKSLRILGIRGIPAAHGGFETFAEYLSLYLVAKGWKVVVYQQEEGHGKTFTDTWNGVERIHIPVSQSGPLGTIIFDLLAILHAKKSRGLCLTLGYNTALFCAVLRLWHIPNIINMDGIEWARAKWGVVAKCWFWLNDWAGCWLGTHLVADHPEIKAHLASRVREKKITTIAYGAESVYAAPTDPLTQYGLQSGEFLTVIARWEPENSLLEIVSGFSQKPRGKKLVVLGGKDLARAYHRAVVDAASDEVIFLGPIYDKTILKTLRFHSMAYVHGHQVGGTNPSLVEALGAGNAIFAHDNKFNRWVAGAEAKYFDDMQSFSDILTDALSDEKRLSEMRSASRRRFESEFTWPHILAQYEELLSRHVAPAVRCGG